MKTYSLQVSEKELRAMLDSLYFTAQKQISDFYGLFIQSYAAAYPDDTISSIEELSKLQEWLPNPRESKYLIVALMRCFRTLEGKDKHENIILPPDIGGTTEEILPNSLRVSEEEFREILGSLFYAAQEQIPGFYELFMQCYAVSFPNETINAKEALFNLRDQLPNEMKQEFLMVSLIRCYRTLEGQEKHENVTFPPGIEKVTEELLSNYPELRNMSLKEMEQFMKDNSGAISKMFNKGWRNNG
ncbi:hypothetical protein O0Q50_22940 [Priestia aryabhattai]|uniref:Uncharacterized protein n=1 Tax=Priestia aryabhattai TaxID=412384 RepID=A0AAX6NDV8_PRIAR|nr:hypothetical protein [Priestia aryabhattai]MDU9694042.1 hypothetical protein [Priestia aryabhattai]